MRAEASQSSWWDKIPDHGHPFTTPEMFATSLRQLSQRELEDYILFRVSTPEENSRPSIDILHDETPTQFLIAAANSDRVLGERITQATSGLFNKFVIKNKNGKIFSADDRNVMSQLSWLVTFGLSKLEGNENDLLKMKDSINYLADIHRFHYLNSISDEFDQGTARALLYAQFSLAKEGDSHDRWLDIWKEATTAEGDAKYVKSQLGFAGLVKVAPSIAVTQIGELADRITSGGQMDSADFNMLFHESSLKLLRIFNNNIVRLKEALAQINPIYAERVISYLEKYK
ncbi:MAG: hypothetical protein Q7R31_03760 [Candidatus Levybacteria bacterium]|nr:hypothetical protein [Candidatus Levybacteria bacterium]